MFRVVIAIILLSVLGCQPVIQEPIKEDSLTDLISKEATVPDNGRRVLVIVSTAEPIGISPANEVVVRQSSPRKGLKEFGLFARDWLQPDPVDTPVSIPTEEGIYDITYSLTSRYTIPANTDPNVLVIQVYPDPNSITNITKID